MSKQRGTIRVGAVLVAGLLAAAAHLQGQACVGAPAGGSLNLEYAQPVEGSAAGVGAHFAAGRLGVGLGYRYTNVSTAVNGHGGEARLSLVLKSRRWLVACPTVAGGVQSQRWSAGEGLTLTETALTGRGGLGLGLEVPVYRGVQLLPYVIGEYAFTAKKLDLDATGGGTARMSGDTISYGHFEYGALLRLGPLYGGVAANRSSEDDRPYLTRYVLGVAFSGRRSGTTP